jgi:hypothetical protein
LIPGQNVRDFYGKTFALGITLVHASQHFGPIAGFSAAGAGMKRDERIVPIDGIGEFGLTFNLAESSGELVGTRLKIGQNGIVRFFGHGREIREISQGRFQRAEFSHILFKSRLFF